MSLNQFKTIAVIVVLLLIGLVFELTIGRKPRQQVEEPKINFDLSGHLTRNNPGLKPDVWYLIYEQPSAPALSGELVFNEDSVCFISDQVRACDDIIFFNGQPVHVEGFEENKVITVSELVVIADVDRAINLYYYNPAKDFDSSGNLQCSRQGLQAVSRNIPVSITPIQDSIRLLLQGNISASEKSLGITTEYPLPGMALKGANLKDGILTLEFDDPQNKTVGGSCRVGILWFQIEATAKQFPEVREVKFKPEELFQP